MFRFGIFLIIIIIHNKEYFHFKYNGIAYFYTIIYTIQLKKAIKNALFLYIYLNFFFNNE